jgi:tetratricopeptide (TPR) repeat protein
MNVSPTHLASALKKARLSAGFSLEYVARGICSESYLSLIESGKRAPSKTIRDKLLQRLHISPPSDLGQELSLDFRIVEMALKIGDRGAAARALPLVEDTSEINYLKALEFELSGNLTKALSVFEALRINVAGTSLELKTLLALSRVRRDLGFTEQAIAEVEEFFARNVELNDHESLSMLLELRAVLSSCYLVKGNVQRALSVAKDMPLSALASWENVVTLWARASAKEAIGDYSGALKDSQLASEYCRQIDRPIAEARLNLMEIQCLVEMGEVANALFNKLFEIYSFFASRNLYSDMSETLLLQAQWLFQVDRFAEADACLVEALKLFGGQTSELKIKILCLQSVIALENGSLEKSKVIAESAESSLKLQTVTSPSMAAQWKLIGEIFWQLGEKSRAFECMEMATDVLGVRGASKNRSNRKSANQTA